MRKSILKTEDNLKELNVIKFILNEKEVNYSGHPGVVVLDYVRYMKNMTGTKIGCREGDCGACTVLVGEIIDGRMRYRSMTSCLMPLANAHGKHIVTIEGVNMDVLNPVQQAMNDEGATQCGFCTPGFVMSLAGFCLREDVINYQTEAMAAIDGNICRCTGYKSIQRAVSKIAELCSLRKNEEAIVYVSRNKILPDYFSTIKEKLALLQLACNNHNGISGADYFVSGGTDLYVQKHDVMPHAKLTFLSDHNDLSGISEDNGECVVGANSTVTDLIESSVIRKAFPEFEKYYRLVSSTPIRNMATIAGNLVNASPIGDFTAFFLALDASIELCTMSSSRTIKLKDFYLGYKKLDKQPDEFVKSVRFPLPSANARFNFEKVCKRTNLDIASVNSAILIETQNNIVLKAGISAGGVGPTPLFLNKSSEFITGKKISIELIKQLLSIIQTEISPISDVRGTVEYKRRLLNQLVKGHFAVWFPELVNPEFITM